MVNLTDLYFPPSCREEEVARAGRYLRELHHTYLDIGNRSFENYLI